MRYAALAASFERLEGISGRLEMTAVLVELLGKVPEADMTAVVRLLQGAVAPDWEGLEMGLAEKQILKALAIASGEGATSGAGVAAIEKVYHEKGDLGLAAEAVLARRGGRKQASLFGPSELTVKEVFATLQAIARTTGAGSQEAKQRLLAKLLVDAGPLEARYVTRTVAGRLRLGVADMMFLDALAAWHVGRGVRSVQDMEEAERAEQESVRKRLERAFDVRSDLAVVAGTLVSGGMAAIDELEVEVGTPVRPMAAERLKSFAEILDKMGGHVAMEYKYDGIRVQAHVEGGAKGAVRLFSRRLEDITAQYPDVLAALRAEFAGRKCIVEGEAVAVDAEGKLRPFQDVSRRRGRKDDLAAVAKEVPVTLFLFDCIAESGRSVMAEPYAKRRLRLGRMVHGKDAGAVQIRPGSTAPLQVSSFEEAHDERGLERFFEQALEDGAEGIMCKDPQAPYKAGSRGFAWVKFKADYQEGLADTMDLVCVGAFYGRGRRAGWYGALLMAARDEETGAFASVCKLGTGFDDATLKGLKERFAPFACEGKPKGVESALEPDVWFEPGLVMEVEAAELTVSPTHRAAWGAIKPGAGLAARFPRFTGRWRTDKGPGQATTVKELVGLYRAKH